MKKAACILGSPRRNGNSNFMAEYFIQQLTTGEYFSGTVDRLAEMNIKPCSDCRGCKKGDLTCIVKDDMQAIYNRLEAADTIILSTPIYWYGPTAQAKVVLDRLRPYYGNKRLSGKKAALLMAAGSGTKDCDLTLEMFRRMCAALGMDFVGSADSESFDIGDATQDNKAIRQMDELAKAIL